MHLFLFGIILLVLGYLIYGKIVAQIIGPDDRPVPAVTKADGVDFVVLPRWKNALIQLLNIAGIGPVIGVILGIKFGSVVFLIIPIGCILGGAVHDFAAGMMSIRAGGANLPILVRDNLGRYVAPVFSLFVAFLLILVVTVFINIPAKLTNGLITAPTVSSVEAPQVSDVPQSDAAQPAQPKAADYFWVAVAAIFAYYILATLFPVDVIIGRLYPIFGGALLVGTAAIFGALLLYANVNPNVLVESDAFREYAATKMPPIIPCLFVTIACGILSGFHATQSPIIARTMATEREALFDFYGMMITEGIIAMIWAAGALAIYNLFPEYLTKDGTETLAKITGNFLGKGLGTVTVIAVIVLAITSGDTALRSLRLTVAEILHIRQKSLLSRVTVVLPFIAIIFGLLLWSNQSPKTFGELWNYFAWGNQTIASVTLMAATVWLKRQGKNFWITFLPGIFMTFVVITFILWTSKEHGGPAGLGISLHAAYISAGVATAAISIVVARLGKKQAVVSE